MAARLRCPYCKSIRHDILAQDGRRCLKCGRHFYFTLSLKGKRYRYFSDDNLTKPVSDEEKQLVREGIETEKKIPVGEWLYGAKHRVTREYKYVIAVSIDQALKKLDWEHAPTWVLPIKYGGDPKPIPIPHVSVDLAAPAGDTTVKITKEDGIVTKIKTVKKPKQESGKVSIKSLVIEALKLEPQIGKEAVLKKIFEILKTKAEEKGGRSDDEHLTKRAKLTYYFNKGNAGL